MSETIFSTDTTSYIAQKIFGKGLYGYTWLAYRESDKLPVVIKLSNNPDTGLKVLQAEANTLRELEIAEKKFQQHYAIRLLDDALNQSPAFLVLELASGQNVLYDLLHKIDQWPLQPDKEALFLEIAFHFARALQITHSAGYVYDDMKLENLFWNKEHNPQHPLRIIDWNVVSPTLKRGVAPDWARFGARLFQMMTGQTLNVDTEGYLTPPRPEVRKEWDWLPLDIQLIVQSAIDRRYLEDEMIIADLKNVSQRLELPSSDLARKAGKALEARKWQDAKILLDRSRRSSMSQKQIDSTAGALVGFRPSQLAEQAAQSLEMNLAHIASQYIEHMKNYADREIRKKSDQDFATGLSYLKTNEFRLAAEILTSAYRGTQNSNAKIRRALWLAEMGRRLDARTAALLRSTIEQLDPLFTDNLADQNNDNLNTIIEQFHRQIIQTMPTSLNLRELEWLQAELRLLAGKADNLDLKLLEKAQAEAPDLETLLTKYTVEQHRNTSSTNNTNQDFDPNQFLEAALALAPTELHNDNTRYGENVSSAAQAPQEPVQIIRTLEVDRRFEEVLRQAQILEPGQANLENAAERYKRWSVVLTLDPNHPEAQEKQQRAQNQIAKLFEQDQDNKVSFVQLHKQYRTFNIPTIQIKLQDYAQTLEEASTAAQPSTYILDAIHKAIADKRWDEANALLRVVQKSELAIEEARYKHFERQINAGIADEQALRERIQTWLTKLDAALESINDQEFLKQLAKLETLRPQETITQALIIDKEQAVIQRLCNLAEHARTAQNYAEGYRVLQMASVFAPHHEAATDLLSSWLHEDTRKLRMVLEAGRTQDAETEAQQLAQIASLVQGLTQFSETQIEVQRFLTRMQAFASNPTLSLATIRNLEAYCRPWDQFSANLFLERINTEKHNQEKKIKDAWKERYEDPIRVWKLLQTAAKDNPYRRLSISGGEEQSYSELRISFERDVNNEINSLTELFKKMPLIDIDIKTSTTNTREHESEFKKTLSKYTDVKDSKEEMSLKDMVKLLLEWIKSYKPTENTSWLLPQNLINNTQIFLQKAINLSKESDEFFVKSEYEIEKMLKIVDDLNENHLECKKKKIEGLTVNIINLTELTTLKIYLAKILKKVQYVRL